MKIFWLQFEIMRLNYLAAVEAPNRLDLRNEFIISPTWLDYLVHRSPNGIVEQLSLSRIQIGQWMPRI